MEQSTPELKVNEPANIDKEKIDTQKIVAPEEPKPEAVSSEESKVEINWRKFRQEREKERKALEESNRKREEAEKQAAALKSALEAVVNKPTHIPEQPVESFEDETDEQRISRLVQKAIQDTEKRKIEQERLREAQELPLKLAQTYTAFNEVCSDENLDYLQYHYPEVYHAFKAAPDSFEKWGNVYKAIKRFVPNLDSKKEEKKIEMNLKKPQSMSVPGIASTSESMPYRVDEKRRMENWKRMSKIIKGQ